MAENYTRSIGRSKRYHLDAGGAPAETGPFIGVVKNNTDTTRTGKLEVYNEFLSGNDENDPKQWVPVSFVSPFYGYTQPSAPPSTVGAFTQNAHSYGMWFTPPDVGTRILFVFVAGDPNQGYYLGSVVNEDAHHMVPAIGASTNYQVDEASASYFANVQRLPVVEYNDNNQGLRENPRFFNSTKPIHQHQTWYLFNQGLINDPIRGTIGSNSYRESPSSVFGISTPGRPIYQGGYTSENLESNLTADENNPGAVPSEAMKVVGRYGGHSIVLDDGDINGEDQLVRIRTSRGHQIIMSDSGDAVYISHANGQSWFELGAEGTVDVYAANSVNLRSGEVNIHADKNLNIDAAGINILGKNNITMETKQLQFTGSDAIQMYSTKTIGVKSDGSLSLQSGKTGTWNGGSSMVLSAGCIDLNGGTAPTVPKTVPLIKKKLPDVEFEANVGWVVDPAKLETIVSRAPTHEPWPQHNTGVNATTSYSADATVEPTDDVNTALEQSKNAEFTPINAAQYETQNKLDVSVGPIVPEQVTGMLAQSAQNVGQASNVISDALGVGKYGLSPQELEKAGLLKPGTTEFYLTGSEANVSTVLQSDSVWSGKDGVNNLASILGDESLQDSVKASLYTTGYNELRSTGTITGAESPKIVASLVEPASKFGGKAVTDWTKNKAGADTSNEIAKSANSARYAVELADQKISEEDKGFSQTTTTSTGTVNRTVVDNTVTTIVTEQKAPIVRTRNAQTSDPNDPRRLELEKQVNNITNVEIPAAKQRFLEANPGSTFRDFLKSSEYQALVDKRTALQTQIESL